PKRLHLFAWLSKISLILSRLTNHFFNTNPYFTTPLPLLSLPTSSNVCGKVGLDIGSGLSVPFWANERIFL
ncbi:hypothetical protein, partial [Gilliamella sp. Bif1-4]|uniref:hypothetical protein n=1 Tax=Gilliamella sp. Bif1-4 TaxID=3120233 RepID=UPI001C4008F6